MKQMLARWALGLADRLKRVASELSPASSDDNFSRRLQRLGTLWFVADIPLCIDARAIGQLYDALWRPEWEASTRRSDQSSTTGRETGNELNVSAAASVVPAFLKISGSGKTVWTASASRTNSTGLEEEANRSPERRLEQIIELYVANHPARVLWVEGEGSDLSDLTGRRLTWSEVEGLLSTPGPRPLVVFDLGPRTRLMPMACELDSGHVVEIYKQYLENVKPQPSAPAYPNSSALVSDDKESKESKSEYWKFARSIFDSQKVLQTIESSARSKTQKGELGVAGSRFEWIDYRLLGGTEDQVVSVHLHFMPRGEYSTGTFAYQLVRRADKFGVRLIGTLKKGKDVNVLAAYEL